MSYCLLIHDKVINEGDTIEMTAEGIILGSIKMKVLEIDHELQSFKVSLDDSTIFDMPVDNWLDASIIKKGELSDPNILFKLRGNAK